MRRTKEERAAWNASRPKIGIRTFNPTEIAVCTRLEAEGWEVIKKGWPDFLCRKDGTLRFIEVKSPRRDDPTIPRRFRASQAMVASWLHSAYGIRVEILTR